MKVAITLLQTRDTGCIFAAGGSVRSCDIRSRLSRGGMKATRIRRLGPLMGYNGFKEPSSSTKTATAVLVNPGRLFRCILWLPKGETSLTSTKAGPIIHGLLP